MSDEDLLVWQARVDAEAARVMEQVYRRFSPQEFEYFCRARDAIRQEAARADMELWQYREIARAMDMVSANLCRGHVRRVSALRLFARQWRRERVAIRKRGQRISGLDATEQFVRRIRLWQRAGVI